MPQLVNLSDRAVIEKRLRFNTPLNIYQIGDLDDFFWPHTKWYGLMYEGEVTAIALLYAAPALPTLLLLAQDSDVEDAAVLASKLIPQLPQQVYCHLSPGLEREFEDRYNLESRGDHYKMYLAKPELLDSFECSEAAEMTLAHLDEIERFYQESYPGNWFDARMLETRHYFGIWDGGRLAAAGGVHVYSPKYGVAALGNIATHPSYRGRGFGTKITAAICRKLLTSVSAIGLNVKANNAVAVSCYQKLGFEVVTTYREIMAKRKA